MTVPVRPEFVDVARAAAFELAKRRAFSDNERDGLCAAVVGVVHLLAVREGNDRIEITFGVTDASIIVEARHASADGYDTATLDEGVLDALRAGMDDLADLVNSAEIDRTNGVVRFEIAHRSA